MYTLRFNLGIYDLFLFYIMADVKPFMMLYLIISLTDAIVKVTVADFIAAFLAGVIAIIM